MRFCAQVRDRPVYALLELTPPMLDAYHQGELSIRSDKDREKVVACTKDATLQIKRLNQTNSLFVSTDEGDTLQAFGAPQSLLEITSSQGSIDWHIVPIYYSGKVPKDGLSLDELRSHCLCSDAEFDRLWEERGGVVVQEKALLIDDAVIHSVVSDLVATVIAEGLGLGCDVTKAHAAMDATEEPIEVVTAVHTMFWNEQKQELDAQRIAKWIGRYILSSSDKEITLRDLMSEWSQELPLTVELDLSMLKGCYVEMRPEVFRPLDRSILSENPKVRFQQLFELKREWGLNEIGPFISDLMPATGKLESWVLKFARKTKRGGKLFVSKR